MDDMVMRVDSVLRLLFHFGYDGGDFGYLVVETGTEHIENWKDPTPLFFISL